MNSTLDFVVTHSNTQEMEEILLSPHKDEINLSDGIMDVKTGKIREYTKEDYKFQKLPYPSSVFDNYTAPEKWLNFLDEILE